MALFAMSELCLMGALEMQCGLVSLIVNGQQSKYGWKIRLFVDKSSLALAISTPDHQEILKPSSEGFFFNLVGRILQENCHTLNYKVVS